MQTPISFALGHATVSVLHLGALQVRLASSLRLEEVDWPEEHRPLFAAPVTLPAQ